MGALANGYSNWQTISLSRGIVHQIGAISDCRHRTDQRTRPHVRAGMPPFPPSVVIRRNFARWRSSSFRLRDLCCFGCRDEASWQQTSFVRRTISPPQVNAGCLLQSECATRRALGRQGSVNLFVGPTGAIAPKHEVSAEHAPANEVRDVNSWDFAYRLFGDITN